jgi:hypothetical protein
VWQIDPAHEQLSGEKKSVANTNFSTILQKRDKYTIIKITLMYGLQYGRSIYLSEKQAGESEGLVKIVVDKLSIVIGVGGGGGQISTCVKDNVRLQDGQQSNDV